MDCKINYKINLILRVMSFNYSPKVASNGLILYLDAANKNSYVSGSLSWNNLAARQNNGTLVNGPTFNTGSGGSIVFDGTNDYVGTPIFNYGTGDYTWTFWLKASSQLSAYIGQGQYAGNIGGTIYGVLRNDQGLSNMVTFQVASGGGSQNILIKSTSNVFTNNVWFNITVTWNFSTKTLLMYINGTQTTVTTTTAGTITTLTPTNQGIRVQSIGMYDDSRTNIFQFNGNMSTVNIYNRVLSATEVLQNYNTLKGRYGL